MKLTSFQLVSNRHLGNHLETTGSCKKITIFDAEEERLTTFSASYRALSKLNWKPERKSVFIKHDIGETANIDPEIVKEIIHYPKEFGIKDIIIGESSVETEYESTPYNFDYCGWDKLAKEEGVKLMDPNRAERTEISWRMYLIWKILDRVTLHPRSLRFSQVRCSGYID